MSDEQSQEISSLLSQLYSTEIEGTFYSPSAQAQQEVPRALLAIANESGGNRDKVIRALIKSLKDDADGGEDFAFYTACDLLGKLKAVEALDTLVEYLDYQPDRIGASLYYKPSVKGIIQIGEPAIHKLEKAVQEGKSVLHPHNNSLLRSNAVTALSHIGGIQAKAALERTYALEKDEQLKEWIEFGIRQIEMASAEKQSGVTRVRPGDPR